MDADHEVISAYSLTRDKTIELAECIPDDWLTRQAEGEEHSLGLTLQHIVGADAWWMHRVMDDNGGLDQVGDPLSREQIASLLRTTRDRVVAFFSKDGAMQALYPYPRPDGQTRPLSGRWCLLYLLQHEVHHRGKVVLALQQWGLSAIPFLPYSGWD